MRMDPIRVSKQCENRLYSAVIRTNYGSLLSLLHKYLTVVLTRWSLYKCNLYHVYKEEATAGVMMWIWSILDTVTVNFRNRYKRILSKVVVLPFVALCGGCEMVVAIFKFKSTWWFLATVIDNFLNRDKKYKARYLLCPLMRSLVEHCYIEIKLQTLVIILFVALTLV